MKRECFLSVEIIWVEQSSLIIIIVVFREQTFLVVPLNHFGAIKGNFNMEVFGNMADVLEFRIQSEV